MNMNRAEFVNSVSGVFLQILSMGIFSKINAMRLSRVKE